jgi:hypothetical protein
VLAIALALAALGLVQLTAERITEVPDASGPVPAAAGGDTISGHFQLLLSAPASELRISTGRDERIISGGAESTLGGSLDFNRLDPRVELVIQWSEPPQTGQHRFAKLSLELPGTPTVIHVFDSAGDIEEWIELPLPLP